MLVPRRSLHEFQDIKAPLQFGKANVAVARAAREGRHDSVCTFPKHVIRHKQRCLLLPHISEQGWVSRQEA